MSNQYKSAVKWNWATAKIILPDLEQEVLQKYYQERYGDELTKAIKVAKHNFRKEKYFGLIPQ